MRSNAVQGAHWNLIAFWKTILAMSAVYAVKVTTEQNQIMLRDYLGVKELRRVAW